MTNNNVYEEIKVLGFLPLKNEVRAVYSDRGQEFSENMDCLLLVEEQGKRRAVYGYDQYRNGEMQPFEPEANFLRFETGATQPTREEKARARWEEYLLQHNEMRQREAAEYAMRRTRRLEDRVSAFEASPQRSWRR